ncbi:MAG: 3-isopropylmalate dehydrogenase, partial [Nitrospinota bacterium]
MSRTLALLPGDGVGPEVVGAARRVLEAVDRRFGLDLAFEEAPIGGAGYESRGAPLPPETLVLCRRSAAGLFGAVGGPRWDGLPRHLRPEQGLLSLRRELGLFANLRPAKMLEPLVGASSLKAEVVRGVDLLVVREATGGIYFGEPRGVEPGEGGERAFDTMAYTTAEVVRVVRLAFEIAAKRRRRVTSVDKENVLQCSILWRRVASEVARDYPGVELRHMYVDTAAMELIRDPRQFDVLLMGNLFGDILSDAAAMLTGSIGMLASANLNGAGFGIYEPVHGSAPDIAG